MEPSSHEKTTLCPIQYLAGGIALLVKWKSWGLHNRSENGRGARVTLCAHSAQSNLI
jgi:hypothetical protein